MKRTAGKILIQMTGALTALLVLLVLNADFIKKVYFTDQITSLGLILNGIILLLFVFGIIKLYAAFNHYSFEEKHLDLFVKGKRDKDTHSLARVSEQSIILSRYSKIEELYNKNIPINHGTITSIMLAEESQYISFPKFVNNVLILSGVFGTIISLILALTGASSVLDEQTSSAGMGLILHGMNTALTTTATAIICYFIFTYFFHKLADIQTLIFGKIEEAVLIHIIPDFVFETEQINYQAEKMIKKQSELVENLKIFSLGISENITTINDHHKSQLAAVNKLLIKDETQRELSTQILNMLKEINSILKDGFRLR